MEETITILRVDTGEAVASVQDLRDNVKLLKQAVSEAEIGSKEYQDALNELRVNQNALKDAMYATSASMEDVAKSATGASESYNSLVHRMASLKEEFRSTSDAARRMELGAQINEINTRLKEMDALQGNFQRNVGNYAGAMKEVLEDMPSFMGPVKGGLEDINKSMGLLTKNPLLGIVTLLFPLIMKITEGLKENETAIGAVNKATKALQPVFNLVTKTVETLAGWISKAVDWFVELLDANKETFSNIVSGAVGVGNALLQYLLTPIKTIVEAAKGLGNIFKDIFTGNFKQVKEDAAAAFDGIKDAFKDGFDFKGNFQLGKEAGEKFLAGLGSTKKNAKDTGKEVGQAVADGIEESMDKMLDEVDKQMEADFAAWEKQMEERAKLAEKKEKEQLAAIDKDASVQSRYASITIDDERARQDALYEIQKTANEKRLAALEQFSKDALARGDLDGYLEYQQQVADLSVEIKMDELERQKQLEEQYEEDHKARMEANIAVMQWAASNTSSILNSIADMYDANSEGNKKNAKRAKNLRIAGAIIDTISGAVTALATAQQLGPIAGPIVGAVNAAAITAAGIANVMKIRQTQVDGSSSGGAASATTVSAPRLDVGPQQTTLVQGDQAEQRLNDMAKDQRVFILQSDIEAANHTSQVQVAEASF